MQIAEAQQAAAQQYLQDGGYELACPPLRAVLSIMAVGDFEGKSADDPAFRQLFTRGALLQSDWYARRLQAKQARDQQHWERLEAGLLAMRAVTGRDKIAGELNLQERLNYVKRELKLVSSAGYQQQLTGSLGLDPLQSDGNS